MTKKPLGVLFIALSLIIGGVLYLIIVLTGIYGKAFPNQMNIVGDYLPVLYALSGVGGIILAIGMLKAQSWAWVLMMIILVAWLTFYVLTVNILNVILCFGVLYYLLIPGVRTYFKIPTD